jgi:hypothetical protein
MLYEQIPVRYPLLLRSMRATALLSHTESEDCVHALQGRRLSGEAVNHFGGPLEVLAAAIRYRHYVSSMYKTCTQKSA